MSGSLEEILAELSVKKSETEKEKEAVLDERAPAATDEEVTPADERSAKVASFRLEMDIDGEFGEYEEPPVPETTEAVESDVSSSYEEASLPQKEPTPNEEVSSDNEPAEEEETPKNRRGRKRARMDEKERALWGCAGGAFYVLAILGVSLVLACVIIMATLDLTGIGKSSKNVRVVVEDDATSETIGAMLKENGLIKHPFFFRVYSNITGEDSEFKSGVYTFAANMGYGNIVDMLRAGVPRKIVTITIPEGYTVDKIAALMEEKSVCTKKDFYEAVLNGDYSDYTFVASIPEEEGIYAGRGYALEGYLYPDTYEFYTGSTGETVVRKLLTNFDNRIDTTMRTKIQMASEELGLDLDLNDVVVLASIVQAEAGSDEWSKVARVLINRMKKPTVFPRLECDSTLDYYKSLDLAVEGLKVDANAYNSYTHSGLIPGAINNPGMKAIQAVLEPASLNDIKRYMAYRASGDVEGSAFAPLQYRNDAWNSAGDYYFFATDLKTGVTYYTTNATDHGIVSSHYGI